LSDNTKRVLVAVILAPVVLATAKRGGLYFLIFVDLVILFGIHEFFLLERRKGRSANRFVGSFLALALSWEFYFGRGEYIALTLSFSVLLILGSGLLRRGRGSALADIGAELLGVLYVGWLGSFLLVIRGDPGRSDLGNLTVLVILMTWSTDTFAYFTGLWVGRHKLFPRISPAKSLEGCVGGLVGALFVAFLGSQTFVRFVSLPNLIALGTLVGTGGQIGDLVESSLKRDAGVKDSSKVIPGHGGVLDRFDSLLFSAPLAYLYMKISGII